MADASSKDSRWALCCHHYIVVSERHAVMAPGLRPYLLCRSRTCA